MSSLSNFYEQNRKPLLYGISGVLALSISFQLFRVITAKPQVATKAPYVRTITITSSAFVNNFTYPGEVRGRQESNLAFQVSGKINQRLVNLGDSVIPGQVLMTLDAKDVLQATEAAQATLASAQANYKLAADNAERYKQLYQGGAVGKAAYEQYMTQLEAAKASLRQAQAQATVSGNQLEYTSLKSDVHGTVAALNAEVGQVIGAGTPAVTVIATGSPEVHINVPENALGKLKLGQSAKISFWALDQVLVPGHIREIASMADPLTKTYKVAVSLDQVPAEVKLGMTAKVLLTESADNPVQEYLIPPTAIYKVDAKTQVWKVKNKIAEPSEIKISGYKDNYVRVSHGLEPGDVIITAGLSKLTPKQEVRLLEEGEK